MANYDGNYTYGSGIKGQYREQTTDVGIFPPNPFGLFDMHGNVWEWCQDTWHENYDGAPIDSRTWINGNNNHPLRGGAWDYNLSYCRSAFRVKEASGYWYDSMGFRVVVASVIT